MQPSSNIVDIQRYFAPGAAADVSNVRMDEEEGSLEITNPDGTVTVVFNLEPVRDRNGAHYDNLAEDLTDAEMSLIASDLIMGIEADDQSRSEWVSMRAK